MAPLVRVWPQENLFARAEQGLDVLALIGTDVALMHLYQMSQKLKSKALQDKARAKLEEIAGRRGLTPAQLADRLVPDLDLEPDGSCSLSYGSRCFRVIFDEHLRPQLLDPDGKAIKDLPKGGAQDDAALVEEANRRWKALKKDVKTLGSAQILRLELAMGQRRRWSAEAWTLFLLQHPLLQHLVRRLVWGVYHENRLVTTFRVAEDGTLADIQDECWTLPSDALVGIPHPLELTPEQLKAWGQGVFRLQHPAAFSSVGSGGIPPWGRREGGYSSYAPARSESPPGQDRGPGEPRLVARGSLGRRRLL